MFFKRSLWFPFLLLCSVISFVTGGFLILHNMRSHLVFFVSPSILLDENNKKRDNLRIGGLVVRGSLVQHQKHIAFDIRDFEHAGQMLSVVYSGALPSLFAEGQGVIVDGYYDNNIFHGQRILAKHDEQYSPKK